MICNAPAVCKTSRAFVNPVRVPHETKLLRAAADKEDFNVFDCGSAVGSAALASSDSRFLEPRAELDIDRPTPDKPIGETQA